MQQLSVKNLIRKPALRCGHLTGDRWLYTKYTCFAGEVGCLMLRENSRITVKTDGTKIVIAPLGEIDHHSARALRERIDSELYNNRPEILILDLSGIDFMDSSGLGLLLGRWQRAREIGCEMRLRGCSSRTMKILELAGAEKLFAIEK